MPTGYTTLLDIANRSQSDALVGLIEDVTTYAPEFSIVPATTRVGTTYRVTRRTGLPTAGFRSVNEGASIGKSSFVQEVKEMYFLDVPLQVDEAAVQGDDGSAGDFLTQEAQGALQSAIITLGSQMYYGTTANAKGFVGLQAQSVGKWPTGGTTNSTSAYLVWLNDQGVQFVVGRDGNISMPAWAKQAIVGGTAGAPTQRMAFVSNLSGYVGLQVGSASAVWRVSGITTAAPLTDERGAGLLSKVPLNRRGGLRWFMNRTAAYTLAKSRASAGFVATASGGSPTQPLGSLAAAYADLPSMLCGVPITITDSLVDTETNAGSADTYAAE
jgi:hypothetical protein